jgi:hypothetical protein
VLTTVQNDQINLWLEWIGTAFLIFGTAVNSLGYYPHGPILLCVGGVFWLVVAVRWRKLSLIAVNSVMMLTAVSGMLWRYFA